jgi:hypothetical protein
VSVTVRVRGFVHAVSLDGVVRKQRRPSFVIEATDGESTTAPLTLRETVGGLERWLAGKMHGGTEPTEYVLDAVTLRALIDGEGGR